MYLGKPKLFKNNNKAMEKFSESLDHINAKKKSRQVYCGKIYSFYDMITCV